jgi:hypothetical protein
MNDAAKFGFVGSEIKKLKRRQTTMTMVEEYRKGIV